MKSEILAPLGHFAYLNRIIDAGANAVYVGLYGYSSRPKDSDLTFDEITEVIKIAHCQDVRVHIAINGCISEKQVLDILEKIYKLDLLGADAFIIADFYLIKAASKIIQNAEIHASTLLGVYNSYTVKYLKRIGVSRIVLSTELTIEEISKLIENNPDMMYELVADGGICFNSNRLCNLPHCNSGNQYQVYCQLPYYLYKENNYLGLAKQIGSETIRLHETIGLYLSLGVYSFKLEGRTNDINYICKRVTEMKYHIQNYIDQNYNPLEYLHYINRLKGK